MKTNTNEKPAKEPVSDLAKSISRAERNRAYLSSPEYKERRKIRYAEDSEYREKCRANTRYQCEMKTAPKAKEYKSAVREKMLRRASIGKIREIDDGRELTFTVIELAELICRPATAVRFWINTERFPKPIHKITKISGVYTDRQALALCDAMVKHIRTATAHLTVKQTKAILALRNAML